MRVLILIVAGLALAGCQTDQAALPAPLAPIVSVDGPTFPATAFQCGAEPVAPNTAALEQAREGSAAARYEAQLRSSFRRCRGKLASVGRHLAAAGQVVK